MTKFTPEEISLCKQVAELKERKQWLLNKLYDLGLAPFYGYYEVLLGILVEEK